MKKLLAALILAIPALVGLFGIVVVIIDHIIIACAMASMVVSVLAVAWALRTLFPKYYGRD